MNYILIYSYKLSIILGGLILFSICSCNLCQDCGENSIKPLVDNLPYKQNQLIEFRFNGLSDIDTFSYEYHKPEDQYNCNGKEGPNPCYGSLIFSFGKFEITYYQSGVDRTTRIGPICYSHNNFYTVNDTIDFNHNGVIVKAIHLIIDTIWMRHKGQVYYDSINTVGRYYYSLDLTFNNQLLKYQVKNHGKLEDWIGKYF